MAFSDIAPLVSIELLAHDIFLVMEDTIRREVFKQKAIIIDSDIMAYGTEGVNCYKVDLVNLSTTEIPFELPLDLTIPPLSPTSIIMGDAFAIVWSTSTTNALKLAKLERYTNFVFPVEDIDLISTFQVVNIKNNNVVNMTLENLISEVVKRTPLMLLGVTYVQD